MCSTDKATTDGQGIPNMPLEYSEFPTGTLNKLLKSYQKEMGFRSILNKWYIYFRMTQLVAAVVV